jgi:Tfp pilus assembly protein PilO
MKSPNLNRTEQILIFAFILLTFGLLLYKLMIDPELKRIGAARSQLDSRQDLLNMESKGSQHRLPLNARVQELQTEMAAMRELLLSRDEVTDFLRSLSQSTSQTGSALTTIAPHDMDSLLPSDEGDFITVPVEIAINGDYSEMIRFFEQLQECRQLINISRLNIATARDPAGVDAELTLNLYVYED